MTDKRMHLPFAAQAIVSRSKLTEYLLNTQHPQGKSKAIFFERLGFDLHEPDELGAAMLEIARTTDMTETETEYGVKYIGRGIMVSPTGREAVVTTVWILQNGEPPPMLVTAFPG